MLQYHINFIFRDNAHSNECLQCIPKMRLRTVRKQCTAHHSLFVVVKVFFSMKLSRTFIYHCSYHLKISIPMVPIEFSTKHENVLKIYFKHRYAMVLLFHLNQSSNYVETIKR